MALSDAPVGQVLAGLINATTPGPGQGQRTAWEFTSSYRLLSLGGDPRDVMDLTSLSPVMSAQEIQELQTEIGKTDFPLTRSLSVIRMAINPHSITWKQPKRWVKQDTQTGSAFMHFTNSKGQNNDILTLSFQGNTGNLDVRGDLQGQATRTGALQRLAIWHNLYQLTREPVLLGDGVENVFSITINTQLMPLPIEFRGFFNSVLEFTESAEKPNSRDYSFEFTVQSVTPSLDDLVTEVQQVLDAVEVSGTRSSTLYGTLAEPLSG